MTKTALRAAGLVLWIGFALITAAALNGWTLAADTRGILALRDVLPPLDNPMRAASWLGLGEAAIPAALLIAFLLYRRGERAWSRLYVVACLSGWALNIVLKAMTRRVRPQGISPKLTQAGWLSFPSGHAMMAMLVYGFGAVLLARTLRSTAARGTAIALGGVITLLVGVSRVYLGAHWPTDVLAGFLAGSAWAVSCVLLQAAGISARFKKASDGATSN